MSDALRLVVLTPVETILEAEEVSWVKVELADGMGLGIFPGHAPLLAETLPAPVRYADPDGEHRVEVEGGILQIASGEVTLFTPGSLLERPSTAESEEEGAARFDRLAQALLEILQRRSEESASGSHDEKGG